MLVKSPSQRTRIGVRASLSGPLRAATALFLEGSLPSGSASLLSAVPVPSLADSILELAVTASAPLPSAVPRAAQPSLWFTAALR